MRLRPDFVAMARQAHEFFGQQRFQNTYPADTLEYLSKGTFIVQKIDPIINADLGVTLIEGTEHKRAWSLFEAEIVDHPWISIKPIPKHRILDCGHRRAHSAVGQTESFKKFEKRLAEREKAEAASIDRLLEPDDTVEMAEKASRKRKRTESVSAPSTTTAPVVSIDSSNNSATGATLDPPSDPGAVNDDDFAPMLCDGDPKEIEIVLFTKKLPRSSAGETLENQPTTETINKADLLEHEKEGTFTTSATGDVQEHKAAEETKKQDVPKPASTSWAFGNRYNKKINYKIPSKPPPPSSPPPPALENSAQRRQDRSSQMSHGKRLGGGPKPVNRLSNDRAHSNPDHQKQVPNRPNQDKINLHGNQYTRREEPHQNNKRQKLEHGSMDRNGSTASYIDLENSQAGTRQHNASSSARSTHTQSHYGNGRQPESKHNGTRVGEYRTTDEMVKVPPRPRDRQGGSSVRQSKSMNGMSNPRNNGKLRNGKIGDPINPLEIEDDPIVDPDPVHKHSAAKGREPLPITPIPKDSAAEPSESHSAVEIKSLQPNENTRYQGTANLTPARGAIKASAVDTKTSHYFPKNEYNQQKSSPAKEPTLDSQLSRSSKLREQLPAQKQRNDKKSSREYEYDSVDELAGPEPSSQDRAKQVAERLVNEHKTSRKQVESTSNSRQVSINLDESDDEDQAYSTVNLQRTIFSRGGRDLREVFMIFTQNEDERWLTDPGKRRWFLNVENKEKRLSLWCDDQLIWQLFLSKIGKFEYHEHSDKIVLHKSSDSGTPKGSHIYIQFVYSRDCEELRRILKQTVAVRGHVLKTIDYLEKVFINIPSLSNSKSKRPIEEEPDDVNLIEVKKQRRDEQSLGKPHESLNPEIDTNPTAQAIRAKGLAQKMQSDDAKSTSMHARHDAPNPKPTERANKLPAHPTRSSTRTQDYIQNQRERVVRSPSPVRWSLAHPDWIEKWTGSVVYPLDDKNKTTVEKQDIPRLDDGEFLNDNLIQFYLNFMEQKLIKEDPVNAKRIYFMNTFFYERLTQGAKGKSSINYEAVERWTSKVDLFEYDYIIVPVNEALHWYVAIICNAPKLIEPTIPRSLDVQDHVKIEGQLAENGGSSKSASHEPSSTTSDAEINKKVVGMSLEETGEDASLQEIKQIDDAKLVETTQGVQQISSTPTVQSRQSRHRATKEPVELEQLSNGPKSTSSKRPKHGPKDLRIITLDSLAVGHSKTCTNLRQYLIREAQTKRGIEPDFPGNLGMTAKNIPAQENFYDCGLFLLTYMEKFLENPDGFISGLYPHPTDLTLEDIKWPTALDQREKIRHLLFEIEKEQSVDRAKKAQQKKLAKAGKKGIAPQASPNSDDASKIAPSYAVPDLEEQKTNTKPALQTLTGRPASTPSTKAVNPVQAKPYTFDDDTQEDSRAEDKIGLLGTMSRIAANAFASLSGASKKSPNAVAEVQSTSSDSQPIEVSNLENEHPSKIPKSPRDEPQDIVPFQPHHELVKESCLGADVLRSPSPDDAPSSSTAASTSGIKNMARVIRDSQAPSDDEEMLLHVEDVDPDFLGSSSEADSPLTPDSDSRKQRSPGPEPLYPVKQKDVIDQSSEVNAAKVRKRKIEEAYEEIKQSAPIQRQPQNPFTDPPQLSTEALKQSASPTNRRKRTREDAPEVDENSAPTQRKPLYRFTDTPRQQLVDPTDEDSVSSRKFRSDEAHDRDIHSAPSHPELSENFKDDSQLFTDASDRFVVGNHSRRHTHFHE